MPLIVFAEIDPAVGGIVVAVISALVTYLVAARNLSGKIKNSDAAQLWAESKSIREWSAERVKELDLHIERLEKRLNDVEAANTKLAEENRQLGRDLYECRNVIHDLQGQNANLERQLDEERARVAQLKWEAENAPRRRHSDPPVPDEPNGGLDE